MPDNPPATAPAPAHHNTPVNEYIRRYASCLSDFEAAKESLRDLDKDAKNAGLNPRAMRRVVMLMADETGKKKEHLQNELCDMLQYLRAAGEPMEIE